MAKIYTGTDSGSGLLTVTETDGAPIGPDINKIIVSAGTLTIAGQTATITTGGGGGGSGTVTSITAAADSGSGTAITTSGTFTFTGGTNITTAVSGTTVTINNDSASTVAAGTATQVAYYTGANTIGGDSGLTYTDSAGSKQLSLTDTGAGTMFQIESTDAGASSAPDCVFFRNSATPAPGDDLGVLVFKGNDDGAAAQEYARIIGEANTVTAGSEDGQLDLRVVAGGTLGFQLRVQQNGVIVNPGNDAVTDFIVDTDTVNNAFQVDASADAASFAVPLDIGASINGYAGSAPTDGQLLIGDTASGLFDAATLTEGANITITNAAGAITIAASGGVSLSGSTNNTVATVTGANALAGEANLTFNGTTLGVTGNLGVSGNVDMGSSGTDTLGFFGTTGITQQALPPPISPDPNDILTYVQALYGALSAASGYGLVTV